MLEVIERADASRVLVERGEEGDAEKQHQEGEDEGEASPKMRGQVQQYSYILADLVPERGNRIDPAGAEGRDEARYQRDGEEEGGCSEVDGRVGWFYFE